MEKSAEDAILCNGGGGNKIGSGSNVGGFAIDLGYQCIVPPTTGHPDIQEGECPPPPW